MTTSTALPAPAAARRAAPGPSRTPLILAVCCLAQLMVVLDVSVVIVALPRMRHDLGLSVAGQQWVVNAYTLTFAGFLMLGGRAADLFGRKRIFLLGLTVFTACSLIGGLATDGTWLVLARAAQGLGGAILAPATLSLLTTNFPDPDQRRRALGAWSATAASGAAIGVLLGGVLTESLGWRWVLFVNVPIGAALVVMTVVGVPESRADSLRRYLDVPGALTVTAGLAVLVYGIVGTDSHSWGSTTTVVPLAAGGVLLAAFILIESRFAAHPLVPLTVFRRRSLTVANGMAVMLGSALFGLYFFLSLYIQQVNGDDALRGGLSYLPAGLSTLVAALIGARLVARIGPRRQLVIGPVLTAAGLIWLTALTPGANYWAHIFGPLVMCGFGFGLSFVPMTMAATTGLPPQEAGLAAGLINTTRQVGGAVGLAIMATVAASAVPAAVAAGAAQHRQGAAHALAAALTTGYTRAFLISAFCLLAGATLALLLPGASPARAAQGPARTVSLPQRDPDIDLEASPVPAYEA
ncbi:MAG TPA: MFS transporter [Acidimicrobiales bacterium]|nr:MFS transporter [Acidimicrobiales bacterium]